jgi:oligoribonuclease NrnB/cAMP/cGMP phosphodiesterase (DHH superfamily)
MIVSLSHEHDLDGLGSQAIIQRYFTLSSENRNSKMVYYFADYTDFVKKINFILSTEPIPSRLIISDIGFNESFKEIFSVFKKAISGGCEIFWFDHHIVDESIKEELKSLIHLYVNDTEKCAAEIVKENYMKDDPIASKIAEFARDTDFRTNKYKLASEFQSIISYNRGAHNDQTLKKWLDDESASALKHAKVFPVKLFGDVVISWANIGGSSITSVLKTEYSNAKAFIGIDARYYDIIIHSEFINCREFAREFEGGGHEVRAGFKYPNIFEQTDVLAHSFIEDIKKRISKYRS